MSRLETRPLFTITLAVAPPVALDTLHGEIRRYIPLGEGTVRGAFEGRVLPGGVDWQVVRNDGTLEIEAHYMLERDDGARLEVRSAGVRAGSAEVLAELARGAPLPASAYYFRTHMRFTTGHPDLLLFNTMLAVSMGERHADSVKLSVFEVL